MEPLTADEIDDIIDALEHFVMGPQHDPELDAVWQPYIDKLTALKHAIQFAGVLR